MSGLRIIEIRRPVVEGSNTLIVQVGDELIFLRTPGEVQRVRDLLIAWAAEH